MRTLLSLLIMLASSTAFAQESWKPGAYLEDDLGVLLLFGGVGLHGGANYGPLRAGVGFYRFKSSHRALSGAPRGFDLEVKGVFEADVSYHPFASRMDGPYIRAVAQWKRQQAENRDNGVRADLDSVLVGPELGWVFRLYHGLYLAPRVGALYYARSPQGSHARPVDIGGRGYDNPRHQTFDIFGTLGVGYVFDRLSP